MTTVHRGKTLTASIAAFAVATGGILVPQATAQDKGECTISESEFDWAVRDSWNNYIYGPIADGGSTFEGGVTKIDSSTRSEISYNFTATDNEVDGDTVSLGVDGGVHFQGHDYGEGAILDNEFSNFRLELDGTSAVLYADMHYREFIDTTTVGDWITTTNTALGEWTLTAPVEVVEGKVEFESDGNGKFASEDAIDSFANFYTSPDNDYIAPIDGSFSVDCDADGGSDDGGNDGGSGNGSDEDGNDTPSDDSSSDLASSSDDLSSNAEEGQGLYSGLLGIVSVGGILAILAGVAHYIHQNFSF